MNLPLSPLTIIDPPFSPDLDLNDLASHAAGAVAFRLKGRRRDRTRIAVTLLHGNEPSGARAVLRLLREGIEPECDSIFVLGGLEAATVEPPFQNRFLSGRLDRNRVFGSERNDVAHRGDPDFAFARALLDLIGSVNAEALIDIHNNPGHNPPYGIVLSEDPSRLGLVSLFAERAIVTDLRLGTLMEATDGSMPAVSIEAGRAGDPQADRVAYLGLVQFLTAPNLEPPPDPLEIYSHPVRVELAADARIAFAANRASSADVVFSDMLDQHNFSLIESGTPLGWINGSRWPLVARDAQGNDISRDLFTIEDGVLRTASAFVPIMMTLDSTVAVQDCLFYVVRHEGTTSTSG